MSKIIRQQNEYEIENNGQIAYVVIESEPGDGRTDLLEALALSAAAALLLNEPVIVSVSRWLVERPVGK